MIQGKIPWNWKNTSFELQFLGQSNGDYLNCGLAVDLASGLSLLKKQAQVKLAKYTAVQEEFWSQEWKSSFPLKKNHAKILSL